MKDKLMNRFEKLLSTVSRERIMVQLKNTNTVDVHNV